jgi:hypothetical protein
MVGVAVRVAMAVGVVVAVAVGSTVAPGDGDPCSDAGGRLDENSPPLVVQAASASKNKTSNSVRPSFIVIVLQEIQEDARI